MRKLLCAALVALTTVPAALAGGPSIKQDSKDYLQAFTRGDYDKACQLTSKVFLKSNKLNPKNCSAAMRKALGAKPKGKIVATITPLTHYVAADGSVAYGVLNVYADGSVGCTLFVPEDGHYKYIGTEVGGCPASTNQQKKQGQDPSLAA